jgi:hypothetical protein
VYVDVEHILNPVRLNKKEDIKIRPYGVVDKKASRAKGKKVIVDKILSQSVDIAANPDIL